MVSVERISATGVVAIVASITVEHVVDVVLQSLETQNGPVLVPFTCVIEDDVENNLDSRLMQCSHHFLELVDLTARRFARGISTVRRQKRHRIVTPIVGAFELLAQTIKNRGTREPASIRQPLRPTISDRESSR